MITFSESVGLVPPARASEMSAPARPPKSSSYNNLISEPSLALSNTNSRPLTELFGSGIRTSTPAPASATAPASASTSPKQSSKPDKKFSLSPGKLREKTGTAKSVENFENFASGLQQPEEGRRQPKQMKMSHRPQQKLPTFISLRDLPSKPIAEFMLRRRSPSPPPPPSMSGPNSLKDDLDLPPPPSYSTLKRLSTYRR